MSKSLIQNNEARLGFAPRSQSFAFVASPQYAQSVRYPDFTSFHPFANPPNSRTEILTTISFHKKAPPMVELLYGAGDEARTRDILLGKDTLAKFDVFDKFYRYT